MSQENVEVVKTFFAAFAERDFEAGARCLDPAVEVRPAIVGGPEGTVYRGPAGMKQFWADVDAAWAEFRIAPEDFRDRGAAVLVLGRAYARGRDSGVVLDTPAGWIARVRERRIVGFQSFSHQRDALEAAGLQESVMSQENWLTLEMTRALPAPRPLVYAAFTDPNQLAKWWGPEGFTSPSLDFEARVGEPYRIEMQPPDGEPFYLTGTFREVDPPRRLAYTFVWAPPDLDDVETLVELSLRHLGEETEVDLTQGRFKTEARRALHRDGWSDSFAKLERLLGGLSE